MTKTQIINEMNKLNRDLEKMLSNHSATIGGVTRIKRRSIKLLDIVNTNLLLKNLMNPPDEMF